MSGQRNNDKMDCRFWEEILEDYLAGTLSAEIRQQADQHLAECLDCRELLATVRNASTALSGQHDDLTGSILAATSGSSCGRACEHLPDLVDETLVAGDNELVQMHLEHCSDCRAVAETLTWLKPVLAEMAFMDPGPDFTAAVLARTSGHTTVARNILDRLVAWWRIQVERPRFALEAAYIATMLIVALVATPISPFREVPGQALQVMRAGPCEIGNICEVFEQTKRLAADVGDRVVFTPARKMDGLIDGMQAGLEVRSEQVKPAIEDLSQHGTQLKNSLWQGRFQAAGQAVSLLGGDLKRIWNDWWQDPATGDSEAGTQLGG